MTAAPAVARSPVSDTWLAGGFRGESQKIRVPPAGLEPATRCLEGSRSLQLSYGGLRREDRPLSGCWSAQRPEPPPIDEPEKKKNQTSKATAARITTTTTIRSAPVIRAVP
jgi:hypothetical protein